MKPRLSRRARAIGAARLSSLWNAREEIVQRGTPIYDVSSRASCMQDVADLAPYLSDSQLRSCYEPWNLSQARSAAECLSSAVTVVCNPGDVVLVDPNCWHTCHGSICSAGALPIALPVSAEGAMRVDDAAIISQLELYPQCRAIIIQNPSAVEGHLYTRDELDRLQRICTDHHLYFVHIASGWRATFNDAQHVFPQADRESLPWLLLIDDAALTNQENIAWCLSARDVTEAMRELHTSLGTSFVGLAGAEIAPCKKAMSIVQDNWKYLADKNLDFVTMPEGGTRVTFDVAEFLRLEGIASVEEFVESLMRTQGVLVEAARGPVRSASILLSLDAPSDTFRQGVTRIVALLG